MCLIYYLFANNLHEMGRFQLQGEEAKVQGLTGS